MRSRSMNLCGLALALTMVAAACGGSSGGGGGGGTESAEGGAGTIQIGADAANNHGTKTVAGSELEVELDDFYFEPTVVQGQPGQKVKLELKNEGSTEHNFSMDDQNIDQDLEDGEDATVTVAIPQSGTMEFYCKYHRSSGMAGELKAT
jgi:plastocyanin